MNIFSDDTSANRSRRWHPVHAIQCQPAGVPIAIRQKGRNVCLLAASDSVKLLPLTELAVKAIEPVPEYAFQQL